MTDLEERIHLGSAEEDSEEVTIAGMRVFEQQEQRTVLYADRPITFEEFVDYSFATGRDLELINGVMVERGSATWVEPEAFTPSEAGRTMAAQLAHEKLFAWLMTVMNLFARRRGLGIVLGSRTPVTIDSYGGRLPDLLFVRHDRLDIVRERGVSGSPDLIVELVSPNDRAGDLLALQRDYRALGVGEIVFINMPAQNVRLVYPDGIEYREETLMTGEWRSRAMPGLNLQVDWLLQEPRPDELDTIHGLLNTTV